MVNIIVKVVKLRRRNVNTNEKMKNDNKENINGVNSVNIKFNNDII